MRQLFRKHPTREEILRHLNFLFLSRPPKEKAPDAGKQEGAFENDTNEANPTGNERPEQGAQL